MKTNNTQLISNLRNAMQASLPGWLAQQEMMPAGRAEALATERPAPHRAGAVVLLLYPLHDELHLLFIKRTVYNGPHSAQVAFPGGRVERSDASLQSTALRETKEEVGVTLTDDNIIGALSELYIPVSHTMVYPFVAFLPEKPIFEIDSREVAYLIEVPLSDLQNSANRKTMQRESNGTLKDTPYFDIQNEVIWGATAMVVCELLALLKPIQTF